MFSQMRVHSESQSVQPWAGQVLRSELHFIEGKLQPDIRGNNPRPAEPEPDSRLENCYSK